MKRRKFLKLAAGAPALLGLGVDSNRHIEQLGISPSLGLQVDDRLPSVLRDYRWPNDELLAVKLCDAAYMRAMTADGAFLESFDFGATWEEVVSQLTDSDWKIVDYANPS